MFFVRCFWLKFFYYGICNFKFVKSATFCGLLIDVDDGLLIVRFCVF